MNTTCRAILLVPTLLLCGCNLSVMGRGSPVPGINPEARISTSGSGASIGASQEVGGVQIGGHADTAGGTGVQATTSQNLGGVDTSAQVSDQGVQVGASQDVSVGGVDGQVDLQTGSGGTAAGASATAGDGPVQAQGSVSSGTN
jgi:hypothetical protein